MTDTSARRPDDAAATGAATPEAPSKTPPEASEAEKVAALVDALRRESEDNKDRLLRALAEMENLRQRTERQVADMRRYGIATFARDVLAVADNMSRALEALDAELREKAEPSVKALLDGVELTERELIKVLEKHGITRFDPKGEKFDPNLHQAMYEAADPSLPAGTIAQVVQPGYMIGDRVLRPALVAVAKGGGKPAAEAEKPADAPANDNSGAAAPDPDDET